MTEFMGLPLHPLMIHLPVVLVPALVLSVILYLLIPPLRRRIGWLVMVLSVLAPAAVVGGWFTGHEFYDHNIRQLTDAGVDTAPFVAELADHMAAGDWLVWLVPAVAPLLWLFGALERGRRAAADRAAETAPPPPAAGDETPPPPAPSDPAAKGRRLVMVFLAIIILGLSGAAGYFVYQSGHTGAEAVWGTADQQ